MKKTLILFFLIIISVLVYAGDFELSDGDMKIILKECEKNLILSKVYDSKTGTEFISSQDFSRPLWRFSVKKDGEKQGTEINLIPKDAESFSYKKGKNFYEFAWKNVRKSYMKTGFDVTVFCKAEKDNSYWHIKISSNDEYGLWQIYFPYIANMDAQNGDEIMYPYRGGFLYNKFDDERGFRKPYAHDESDSSYSKELGFTSPQFIQLGSFTKKTKNGEKVSLYFSSEDKNSSMKSINYILPKPNVFDYTVRNYPENMSVKGHPYNQSYKFNMAFVRGDWYDCAKKYRKWGIENRYGLFAKGKLEDRNDLPEWFKKNPVWLRWTVTEKGALESVLKSQKFLGVECGCHIYYWSVHPFDTFYPNWLPARDEFEEGLKAIQAQGMYAMPYTNALITDINQSPAYKETGSVMVIKNEKGEFEDTPYKNNGADNRIACISSPYYKAYLNEIIKIAEKYNIDALYMDQIGGSQQYLCFDESHNHAIGGGDHFVRDYRKLIEETRKNLCEITGKKIVMTTEDACDAYAYDGLLRCNDEMAGNENMPVDTVIYSGYSTSFGDRYYPKEFETEKAMPARNKVAADLCKGIQPGWFLGIYNEFFRYPIFGTYFKNMTLARKEAIEYFNFGEMTRPVKIINRLPEKELYWEHYTGADKGVYPMVRTAAFNYKGKTAVVFTNISEESIKIDFQSDYKDLMLENKNIQISEFYPKKGEKIVNRGKKGTVEGTYTIKPLETVILLAWQ